MNYFKKLWDLLFPKESEKSEDSSTSSNMIMEDRSDDAQSESIPNQAGLEEDMIPDDTIKDEKSEGSPQDAGQEIYQDEPINVVREVNFLGSLGGTDELPDGSGNSDGDAYIINNVVYIYDEEMKSWNEGGEVLATETSTGSDESSIKIEDVSVDTCMISADYSNKHIAKALGYFLNQGIVNQTSTLIKFIEDNLEGDAPYDSYTSTAYEIEVTPEIMELSKKWKMYKMRCSDEVFKSWIMSL